ncbi:MAG TPA: hypothetical protein VML55_13385 [Planctomycetaceae bacterium]|nr:hypothetical protein [Planctomycetaceae bacterium]
MVDGFDTTIPLLAQLVLTWLCFLATCVAAARRRRSLDPACPTLRNVLSGMLGRAGFARWESRYGPAAMRPVPVRAATPPAGNRPHPRACRPPF